VYPGAPGIHQGHKPVKPGINLGVVKEAQEVAMHGQEDITLIATFKFRN
jgi:hypothetical protein